MAWASIGLTSANAIPIEPIELHTVEISYTVPLSLTDFAASMVLPQFGPSHFASLVSITVTLNGIVQGSFSESNTGATGRTITTNLGAEIDVGAPSTLPITYPTDTNGDLILNVPSPILGQVNPIVSDTRTLGRRGSYSSPTVTGTQRSATTTLNTNPSLAPYASMFIGYGSIYVPVLALDASNYTGCGNCAVAFNTDAGASVTIDAVYETVPEPASLALLSCGLLAASRLRRRIPPARGN